MLSKIKYVIKFKSLKVENSSYRLLHGTDQRFYPFKILRTIVVFSNKQVKFVNHDSESIWSVIGGPPNNSVLEPNSVQTLSVMCLL